MTQSKSDKLQQVNIDLRKEISEDGDDLPKNMKSYLTLDSELLPDIKDWKIGNNYTVKLIVQQLSMEQDDTIHPLESARNKTIAKFTVAKVLEADGN